MEKHLLAAQRDNEKLMTQVRVRQLRHECARALARVRVRVCVWVCGCVGEWVSGCDCLQVYRP